MFPCHLVLRTLNRLGVFYAHKVINTCKLLTHIKVINTYKVPVRVMSQSCNPKKNTRCVTSMQCASESMQCASVSMQCASETRSVACGEESSVNVTLQHQRSIKHTTEGGKKVKKAKKDPKKSKKKRQDAECSDSLMSELPFANTEVWKDLGFTSPKSSVGKKRKRGESGGVESEEKKKKETTRPNYFVSVPITNPKIKQAVEDVQKLVLEKDVRLLPALIPVSTLHITLLVTHLSTQEQVQVAASTLSELEAPLNTLLEGRSLILPFSGVGHFKQEVAFVQIAEGEHLSMLTHIAECVRKAFEERGIASGDDKAFKPHLTFLKLSRAPKLRKQGVKKLDPALFSEFEGRVFGDECVCRVDLCSMLKKKTPDGYYHCEKSITFSVKKAPAPDDEELVSLSKRLVEDAVLRAVQQYMEETQQNGTPPKDEGPPGPAGKLNDTK